MGNLNFQDEQGEKPVQKQTPAADNLDDTKVDDIFVDEPTSGSKFLWVAIVVIIVAGVGGGLFMLNKYGYLNFGAKKPVAAAVDEIPAAAAPAVASKAAPTSAASMAKGSDKFVLQVSAFKTRPLADKCVADLKKKGIDAYVFEGDVPNEGTWFKVCVGSFDTKLRAIAATEEMKKKVGTDVWVIPAQ